MPVNVHNQPPESTAAPATGAETPGEAALVPARSGFPGAGVTGACMIAGPALAVVASALGAGSYHARGAAFVAAMAGHPTQFDLAVQLSLAAMILLLFAVIGLATMIAGVVALWGRVAGVFTVIGLLGPISFESVYWAASRITDSAGHRAAAARLIDQSQIIPRSIMNISGPCLVLGFVLLGVAAHRAGVLDGPRAILLAVTCAIPAGFISGHLVIAVVAFACTTVALAPLGLRLLRAR